MKKKVLLLSVLANLRAFFVITVSCQSASTLQIVDISNLPNSVNTVYDSNSLLNKVHNIFIDTATTKLYACATGEAMEVFDLSNPDNPVLINTYNKAFSSFSVSLTIV